VGEARRLVERDALRKKSKKFLSVFFRQCPFVSFHSRCSCPPRAALAPKGKSRWGLAKATVKIDKNGNKRKQTEKSKTGRRMLNQPESSRSAPGSLVPFPSNERMQSAVLHSPVEITVQFVQSVKSVSKKKLESARAAVAERVSNREAQALTVKILVERIERQKPEAGPLRLMILTEIKYGSAIGRAAVLVAVWSGL
jgi:hypothetical protein